MIARIERALAAAAAPQSDCEHRWMIWPETDGYEQKCSKCGSYRRTPDADREAALADAAAPQSAPGHTDMMVTPESIDAWLEDNPLRDETGMEHIARDMREGRFPDRSPRQQVPAAPAPQPDADVVYDFCRQVHQDTGVTPALHAAQQQYLQDTAPQPAPASDYAALQDRAEKAEEEAAQLTKAHDTVCDILALAAKALADRPSQPGTMAWAIVMADGKLDEYSVTPHVETAMHCAAPGERIVRVAIRIVEDDAEGVA